MQLSAFRAFWKDFVIDLHIDLFLKNINRVSTDLTGGGCRDSRGSLAF